MHNAAGSDRPILANVAALAGVSSMTVSRTLNHPSRVRAETRARVMAAVHALSYRPNPAARALANGRSSQIGVVVIAGDQHGPAAALAGIEHAARRHDYAVNIASVAIPTRTALENALSRLLSQNVEGVLLIAPQSSTSHAVHLLPPGLPLVVVGAAAGDTVPSTSIDNIEGAAQATRHLLDLGHSTVWHLAGPRDWIDADHRATGWHNALTAAGSAIPDPLIGDWSAASGYAQGRRIAADEKVTAVFAANDAMALGLIRALLEAGRSVPGDVSVIGFDDVPEAAYFWPPLTTVRQDFTTLGSHAFDMLMGTATTSDQTIPPDLIIRKSSTAYRSPPYT
jgi:DNA-binding LacI/PurR family transcriptional regulator